MRNAIAPTLQVPLTNGDVQTEKNADLKRSRQRAIKGQSLDRLPPFDLGIERAVLGSQMILSQQSVPTVISVLKDGILEAFYDLKNRHIQEVLVELSEKMIPIDIISVRTRLKELGVLELIGGDAYLIELENSVTSAANLPHWLEKLNEKYLLRRMIAVCTEVVGRVYDYEGEVDALLDEVEQNILAIRPAQSKEVKGAKEIVAACIADLERRWELGNTTGGLSTGFPELDFYCDGMGEGELIILTGYDPEKRDSGGVGKTALAMSIAEHVLIGLKKAVCVFELEMSAEALCRRLIASIGRVNVRQAIRHKDAELFPKMTIAAKQIGCSKLFVDDSSDITVQEIRAKARRINQAQPIDLWIVDYAQLIQPSQMSKDANREQRVADIFLGLKAMARELKKPVIVLSQTNEDGKIRESRAGRHHCDKLWILKPKGESDVEADGCPCELVLDKERNEGSGRKVDLTFLRVFVRFESAAKIADTDLPNYDKD